MASGPKITEPRLGMELIFETDGYDWKPDRQYMPVSPSHLDALPEGDISVYDLEKIAFDTTKKFDPEIRRSIGLGLGKLASSRESHITLSVIGPIEGEYYIELPREES